MIVSLRVTLFWLQTGLLGSLYKGGDDKYISELGCLEVLTVRTRTRCTWVESTTVESISGNIESRQDSTD